jgi:mycofactocin system glycosyltransferase
VDGGAGARLARTLTDRGLLHPVPPVASGRLDVTVVIPVRDRPAHLDRCLSGLGSTYPVIVVDDGSRQPAALAEVAAKHGARLITRLVTGGPAAARNSGLRGVQSDFVVLLDSDCVPTGGWIERLGAHFADPLVAAVAPRIRPVDPAAGSAIARYSRACGALDQGVRPARVAPMTGVPYVPTAALLVRRSALLSVSPLGDAFDERLRYGEDVDLVWRLHSAGWRVRYEPSVHVHHQEPATWPALLTRRLRYGTSAGELARRHPGAMAPLVVAPWPAATVAALLARRPLLAVATGVMTLAGTRQALRKACLPTPATVPMTASALRSTWLGVGRFATQFTAPVVIAQIVRPSRNSRRWRRTAAASLLVGPALADWVTRRPDLDPIRFTVARVADDIAYGAGVWIGSARTGTTAALRPRRARRHIPRNAGRLSPEGEL